MQVCGIRLERLQLGHFFLAPWTVAPSHAASGMGAENLIISVTRTG
jgi:hypothetical protein